VVASLLSLSVREKIRIKKHVGDAGALVRMVNANVHVRHQYLYVREPGCHHGGGAYSLTVESAGE
jgi:hypothetical protein